MSCASETKLSKFSEFSDKGLTGLGNCGNSCYINSCIQVLSHTYELNNFLNKKEYNNKLNKVVDSVILVEWDKLRKLMWSENCTVAPWGFFRSVQKVADLKDRDIFTGYAQNDVQEFLIFLVDCFHNALAREVDMKIVGNVYNNTDKMAQTCYKMMKNMYCKEYSEMLGIFYGIHISKITSTKGELLSCTPEPFSIIDLPIPNTSNPTIYQCFDLYCKNELLEKDNAWYNDKTKKKETANRSIVFWSLPDIMIIDFKRWTSVGRYGSRKKQTAIDTPIENLDMSKYVAGYNNKSYIYDLYGVCNHLGGVSGGHYTAHVKNANGQWYAFNDTNVDELDEDKIVTQNAYCLFYRKKK